MADSAASPQQDVSNAVYRSTLVLFALVAAALVIWFQRHIEPFVTGTLIIGGTISLWGLWQLAWSIFTDAGGADGKDLTRRFLGTRGALRALIFSAFITTLLHFFTASNYQRFEGAELGEREFTVQVLERGRVFNGPFTLHPGDVIGHPTFPSFATHELDYQILEPRGFAPLHQTLRPWGAIDVKVPGSFTRKVFHNIVLVPDAALYSQLPAADEPGGKRFYLAIIANGETALLEDYIKQLVVTGADVEDLPAATAVQGDPLIRQELHDHFTHSGISSPEAVVAALMDTQAARVKSAEFGAGASIVVEIGTWQSGDVARARVKKLVCKLNAPDDGVLHTRVIGPSVEGKCQ